MCVCNLPKHDAHAPVHSCIMVGRPLGELQHSVLKLKLNYLWTLIQYNRSKHTIPPVLVRYIRMGNKSTSKEVYHINPSNVDSTFFAVMIRE